MSNHNTLGGQARGIRHRILHRARDQKLIKRYNSSQCLCHDCSTIEGECELPTSSSTPDTRIPVSLQLAWCTNNYNPLQRCLIHQFAPLHWCHDMRPCSEQHSTQNGTVLNHPVQRLPSEVSSHQPENTHDNHASYLALHLPSK